MAQILVFATGNQHKLNEVQTLLGEGFALSCLTDIGIYEDIPETADTLEGNALQKARYVFEKKQCACFADDTGFEIEALNGEPGVYSARYAGEQKNSKANMQLVLQKLEGNQNRNAKFVTVIAYIDDNGNEYIFKGEVFGTVTHTQSGCEGFGYDPIFQPNGYDKTFAEIPLTEKNKISHRALAMQKFLVFLKSNL